MNVLGLETSCDETAAAIVSGGRSVRSNVIFSQAGLHRPYGGVVPEVASRNHLEYFPVIITKALAKAGCGWKQIDAVAATYGPGLSGSLLVGMSAGRALALRLGIPFIAVNHLEAHLYAPFLTANVPDMERLAPFVVLIVSGGHTCLVRVEGSGNYRLLGTTCDDAAGEAFDKGAKLLGLGYPGGPEINRLARGGRVDAVAFPRGRLSASAAFGGLSGDMCFSFSGLKTALMYFLRTQAREKRIFPLKDIAASYQEAIIDALCERLFLAVRREEAKCAVVAGGVALNTRLREKLSDVGKSADLRIIFAEPQYCMDNAAMVAGLAGAGSGVAGDAAWTIDVSPNLMIGN
ncbi:MAG: tRNA (adenosine(37)-N6)-threonylcarbamoyltransferase complex transferase subunit TsaD [Kiritimatiellae bacterium]|nr:tRNA (adenosine(37)-N6)-threonylcarbamoyltransferase complex transferase subunit TsaD [Kiritimatiellia bacterium]